MIHIDCDDTASFVVVTLSGHLAGAGSETFGTTLTKYVGNSMIVDLAQLELIDSSGLGALIKLVTRQRLGQKEVILVAPSAFVQGVFESTRLDRWFDICPTREAAIQRLSAG